MADLQRQHNKQPLTAQHSRSNHQLIVLGNGFDLACGLKSSYSDFFSSRLQIADTLWCSSERDWKHAVDSNHLTAWDFILRLGTGPNWCDVERAISDWVLPPSKDANDFFKPALQELLDTLKKNPFSDSAILTDGRIAERKMDSRGIRLQDLSRYIWHKTDYQPNQPFGRSSLLAFLQDELNAIESQFKAYLQGQYSSSETYLRKAIALMKIISLDGLSAIEDYDKTRTSVLSFNYTTPFTYDNSVVDASNTVSIHGELDGEIIFGVDGKECMEDRDTLPFTKTYRVASMGVRMPQKLYATTASGINGSSTGAIKFFGHSLGEADYSYFQALFDGVNLYGGNTRLVFYYRPSAL